MFAAWLRDALDHSGLSQAEAARQLAAALKRTSDRSVIGKMLNGTRNISAPELLELSRITGYPPPAAEQHVATVPLVGYVGAGSTTHLFGEAQGPFDEVPAPDGATPATVAVAIQGESLGTIFDGWLVFYDDVRTPMDEDLVNKLCVVGLDDGRVLVKQVKRGQLPKCFNLISSEPPIYDVVIEWAALVKGIRPR